MMLVTGGPGMIGAHTARALVGLGHDVVVTAHRRAEIPSFSPASILGPLMDPESPSNPIPPYISAVFRGDRPRPLHADDGGDWCHAPDAGRAIARRAELHCRQSARGRFHSGLSLVYQRESAQRRPALL